MNTYEIIENARKQVDPNADKVKMCIKVLDHDAPYPLHFTVTLEREKYRDGLIENGDIFEFLTYIDMLLGIEIL